MVSLSDTQIQQLAYDIKSWAKALGFEQVGIADIDLVKHERFLQDWLDKGYHGDMHFMQTHGMKRARPAELLPGTMRVICVRLNYLPPDAGFARDLADGKTAYISRYASGRDYHKVLRKKLAKLGEKIEQHIPGCVYRPFVDSAPVLEHALAEKAGIGWTGKHSLTIQREAGSWFFLGELFVNLPLPIDTPVEDGCGQCTACLTMCPTQAIVAPYTVDARRCISYLTIELDGPIPEAFRRAIGNRVYGCDDCQLVCPWNRFAQLTAEKDFLTRQKLQNPSLLSLWQWDETRFLLATEGSPIRRIGYERWRRNLAIALGNAPFDSVIIDALQNALATASPMVAEHIRWSLKEQHEKHNAQTDRTHQRLIRIVQKGLPRDA